MFLFKALARPGLRKLRRPRAHGVLHMSALALALALANLPIGLTVAGGTAAEKRGSEQNPTRTARDKPAVQLPSEALPHRTTGRLQHTTVHAYADPLSPTADEITAAIAAVTLQNVNLETAIKAIRTGNKACPDPGDSVSFFGLPVTGYMVSASLEVGPSVMRSLTELRSCRAYCLQDKRCRAFHYNTMKKKCGLKSAYIDLGLITTSAEWHRAYVTFGRLPEYEGCARSGTVKTTAPVPRTSPAVAETSPTYQSDQPGPAWQRQRA